MNFANKRLSRINWERYHNPKLIEKYKEKAIEGLTTEEKDIIKQYCHKFLKKRNVNVLVIGSGNGREIFGIKNEFNVNWKFVGIDYSLPLIKQAKEIRKKFNIKNVSFICKDITKIKLKKNSFDIVLAFNCFLDLIIGKNKEKLIKKISEWCKPGGIIIFNLNRIRNFLPEMFIKIIRKDFSFVIIMNDEIGIKTAVNPLPSFIYKKIIFKKYLKIIKIILCKHTYYIVCTSIRN